MAHVHFGLRRLAINSGMSEALLVEAIAPGGEKRLKTA